MVFTKQKNVVFVSVLDTKNTKCRWVQWMNCSKVSPCDRPRKLTLTNIVTLTNINKIMMPGVCFIWICNCFTRWLTLVCMLWLNKNTIRYSTETQQIVENRTNDLPCHIVTNSCEIVLKTQFLTRMSHAMNSYKSAVYFWRHVGSLLTNMNLNSQSPLHECVCNVFMWIMAPPCG